MTIPKGGPTLKDVAELASVSIKTASRVLNEDPKVAVTTRAAVMEAMKCLDYQPDPAARSLRAGTDRLVGVVIDSIGDVFFAQLVATVEAILDAAGYRGLVQPGSGSRAGDGAEPDPAPLRRRHRGPYRARFARRSAAARRAGRLRRPHR